MSLSRMNENYYETLANRSNYCQKVRSKPTIKDDYWYGMNKKLLNIVKHIIYICSQIYFTFLVYISNNVL